MKKNFYFVMFLLVQATILIFVFANCAGKKEDKKGDSKCQPTPTPTATIPGMASPVAGLPSGTPAALALLGEIVTYEQIKTDFKNYIPDCKPAAGSTQPKLNCDDYEQVKVYPTTGTDKLYDIIAKITPAPPAAFVNKVYNWDMNGRPKGGAATPTPSGTIDTGTPINTAMPTPQSANAEDCL